MKLILYGLVALLFAHAAWDNEFVDGAQRVSACEYQYQDAHEYDIDPYDARYRAEFTLSPDEQQLAVATTTSVQVYNASDLSLNDMIILPRQYADVDIDWNSDSRISVSALYYDDASATFLGDLLIIDSSNSTLSSTLSMPLFSVDWSPDGSQIAVLAVNGTMSIFDVSSLDDARWEAAWQLDIDENFGVIPDVIAWSFNGSYLSITSEWDIGGGNSLLLGDVSEKRVLALNPSEGTNGAIADWSPAANLLAVLDPVSGIVKVWDADLAAFIAQFTNSGGNPHSIAWVNGGSDLAIGTNRSLRVWDMTPETPNLILDYSDNLPPFVRIVWSQTLERLFSVDYDGTLYLWDIFASDCPIAVRNVAQ